MLNSVILLAFSWVIAIVGSVVGAQAIFFHARKPNWVLQATTFMIICWIVAAVVRMLANIGQLLFESKIISESAREAQMHSIQQSLRQSHVTSERMAHDLEAIRNFTELMRDHLDQVCCDTQEIKSQMLNLSRDRESS